MKKSDYTKPGYWCLLQTLPESSAPITQLWTKGYKITKAVTHFLVVPWQKCNRESARDLPHCCAVLITCTLLEEKDSSTRCQYFKECNRPFHLWKYFLLYFLWYSLWFRDSPVETSPSSLQPIWSSSWSVHILILRSFRRWNFGWLGF